MTDPSVLQNNGNYVDGGTSVSVAFDTDITNGNLLVTVVGKATDGSGTEDPFVAGDLTQSAGAATLGTIALDFGDAIVLFGDLALASALLSAPITGSGSCTMQIANAATGSTMQITVVEVQNADVSGTRFISGVFDHDTTGSPSVGSVTHEAGCILFAGCDTDPSATITPSAGWGTLEERESSSALPVYNHASRVMTGAATTSVSWTTTSGVWQAIVGGYKGEAYGGFTGTGDVAVAPALAGTGTWQYVGTGAVTITAVLGATGTVSARTATLAGSILTATTETDLVTGGKIVTLTLAGDQWVS